MTWNMTFSFYQSLFSIPTELREAARIYRLSLWQRFWALELPSGVIGLVWNSVMAWAGGWFTLIVIESLTVGDKILPYQVSVLSWVLQPIKETL
jgi:NitT/TauT family transport system permease protein